MEESWTDRETEGKGWIKREKKTGRERDGWIEGYGVRDGRKLDRWRESERDGWIER